MSYVLGLDPGTSKSAWCVIESDTCKPVAWAWEENMQVYHRLNLPEFDGSIVVYDLVIEDVTNMGMAVGKDVFETVRWSGRFDHKKTARFISRPEVKLHLCGSPRAKDPNVKQAIIDRYGGQEVAIGGVKCPACKGKGWRGAGRPACETCTERGANGLAKGSHAVGTGWQTPPGVLYEFSKAGMGSHGWSALGVALTAVGQ